MNADGAETGPAFPKLEHGQLHRAVILRDEAEVES